MTNLAVENKTIVLFSLQNNLQTDLIVRLMGEKLEVPCSTVIDDAEIPDNASLVLIDCNGRDPSQLRQIAQCIQDKSSDMSAALFNADLTPTHESLLEWPCITGIFYNDTNQEQLVRGLKYLLDGDYWVPRKLLHHFFDKNRKAPTNIPASHINLTRRELQILKLIRDGATNNDISKALEVSEHTIKTHLYNTYKKIGVRNRLEASNWARSIGEE